MRPLFPIRPASRLRLAASAAAIAAALFAAACDADRLARPNLNDPSVEGATSDGRTALQLLANGVLAYERDIMPGYVRDVGILGREAFNYTPSEGRNHTGFVVTPGDPAGFGANLWADRWVPLRNTFLLAQVVERAQLLAAEREAAYGFARTMEALDLLYLLGTRHDLGIPVEMKEGARDLAPFVSHDSAYRYVAARLDRAKANLQAGGAAFPFALTSGFAGFDTPATFLQVNRAIAARVAAYRASLGCGASCYEQALAALGESFVDPSGDLARGVRHVFSTASGDTQNGISNATTPFVAAHPSIEADAPRRADGSPDLRYIAKIGPRDAPIEAPGGSGIPSSLAFRHYPTQSSPIPIVRNEELVLLRAEARYFTGDVAGALADLNAIRTRAGGLAPLAAAAIASRDAFVTELLLQRRFSLLLEGHRWIDVRRFDRLETLPLDRPDHVRARQQVVPQSECLVRANTGDPALFGPGCS